MPTTRSDRRPLTGAVLAALLLAGCSGSDDAPPAAPEPRAERSAEHDARQKPVRAPDVVRGLTRALERRADAVLAGDREAFLAGVAPTALEAQATYFDNLAQLPTATFDYRLDPATLVRAGGDYWVEVDVTHELDQYDALPVVTRDRYLFAPAGKGRFRLASMTDPAWEEEHGIVTQPWESGPVTVVGGGLALGIFDAGSAPAADRVLADVERGIAAVAARLPYAWDRRVVVYALSEPDFLAGLDDLPGGDPLALDAVTFPVMAGDGGEGVAATRFVLHPDMVANPGPSRDRLIRHELTHVALGTRQDGAPTWFAEGLAEYVSVQPIAPEERTISGAALDAAEAGFDAMPAGRTFHGPESEAHYGLAWWACEYLAATYDERVLWSLLDAMAGPGRAGTVLEDLLGIDEAKLARKAAKLMLQTYRPEKEKPDDEPSDQPSEEPSEEPSDQPSDEDEPDEEPSDDPSSG